MKNKSETLFNIKDAYYQSWMINENEKGTNIILNLINVQKGVTFDSLIFRGLKLPVFIDTKDTVVILKSILTVGMSKIRIEKEVVDKPNQLLYTFQGIKHSYFLKNIRRLQTKYY